MKVFSFIFHQEFIKNVTEIWPQKVTCVSLALSCTCSQRLIKYLTKKSVCSTITFLPSGIKMQEIMFIIKMTNNLESNCFNVKTNHFSGVEPCTVTDLCACVCDIIQPVSGVRQSEEQEVKEAGELSLQSLTDMVLQFLWLP